MVLKSEFLLFVIEWIVITKIYLLNLHLRFLDNSLCPKELEIPYWMKVYKDSDAPERITHEDDGDNLGDTDRWDYEK